MAWLKSTKVNLFSKMFIWKYCCQRNILLQMSEARSVRLRNFWTLYSTENIIHAHTHMWLPCHKYIKSNYTLLHGYRNDYKASYSTNYIYAKSKFYRGFSSIRNNGLCYRWLLTIQCFINNLLVWQSSNRSLKTANLFL